MTHGSKERSGGFYLPKNLSSMTHQKRAAAMSTAVFSLSFTLCNLASGVGLFQRNAFVPALPAERLQALKQNSGKHGPNRLQIGVRRVLDKPITVTAASAPAEQWQLRSDGKRVWSAQVVAPGALGVRLHLEKLNLPQGVRVLVYDLTGSPESATSVMANDLAGAKDFWAPTSLTPGAQIEIEASPGVDLGTISLGLKELSYLYDLPLTGAPKVGSCDVDLSCYPGYAQTATGVAKIQFVNAGHTFVCSGCLLAASGSGDYFLTANHCISDQTAASSITFFWFYQTTSCNGSAAGGTQTHQGGTILAASSANDFTFLQLRQAAPSDAARLPWSTSQPSSSDTLACIQHPGGSYKRISLGQYAGSDPNFWGVRWSTGVTEDGSSGGPLLNGSQEVIGQLSAGFNGGPGSSCSTPAAPDSFGRFDVTYASIQQWLSGSGGGGGFTPVKGTYTGLFSDPNNITPRTAGSFTISTTTKGTFSGSLQAGPARYSFSGEFDGNGAAEVLTKQTRSGQLSVSLQVDPADSDHITGVVTDNANFSAQLDGDRAIYDGRALSSPQQGQFILTCPGSPDPASAPGGSSYATVNVNSKGQIKMGAALADGGKASQSATLAKSGRWPLYVPTYGGQGMLLGWINFSDGGGLSGTMTWVRPNIFAARYYASGFSMQSDASGGPYQRPGRGQTVLNMSGAQVTLSGGSLSDTVMIDGQLESNNRIVDSSNNKTVLSFSSSTGIFSGKAVDPATSQPVSFSGIADQSSNTGVGYFLFQGESGQVTVTSQ
ncbi:MAG: hypothetical protein C5B50_06760 [Verrucomicrobia bacterium]|nr:MAG: hypothetical protein C5B50_06760 [Verrucomicrobiota bacterium]